MNEPSSTSGPSLPAGEHADALLSRFSLVISTVTSITTLLICLSSDTLSSTLLLWVATGLCFACFTLMWVYRAPARGTKAFWGFFVALGCTFSVLALAWTFAFRDEIRFSKAVTGFSSAPSVLIDRAISRTVLTSKASAPPQRLASFVHGLVETPHRTRICSLEECPDNDVVLTISGIATETRFVIDMSLAQPRPGATPEPNPRSLQDVMKEVDSRHWFLRSAFDSEPASIRIVVSTDGAREAIRAAYHLAMGLRGARGNDRATDMHLRNFLKLVPVLAVDQASRDWILEGMLFAANHYRAAKDGGRARSVIEQGKLVFPKEPRLDAAEAYLRIDDGNGSEQVELDGLPPGSLADPPVFQVLRGVVAARSGDFRKAASFLEKAAEASTRTEQKRRLFSLRLAAAMLASVVSGEASQRGAQIVANAEAASKLYPKVPLVSLLRGFGQALVGNVSASSETFETFRRHMESDADMNAYNYWRARSLAETGSPDQARKILEPMAASRAPDAQTLGLLAELMLNVASDRQSVEESLKVARHALERDPNEVKSNRLLGIHKVRQASALLGSQRQSLKQEALAHLQKTDRGGGADAETYAEMSDIYRDLAKATLAQAAQRKTWDALCSLNGDELACRVVKIRSLLESGSADNVNAAASETNAMLHWLMDNPAPSQAFKRNSMLVQVAIIWYQNKRVNEAQLVYDNVVEGLRHSRVFPEKAALAAQVDCNLGFIYVDKHLTDRAIEVFERALKVAPTADCEAGFAVALEQDGRHEEALEQYRRAKGSDATYGGEIEVLKKANFWSETACAYLKKLSEDDRKIHAGLLNSR